MNQVIISYWSKELGTDLVETSLPLYGSGPATQDAFRRLWKYGPRSTAKALAQHDYWSRRWYRRGNDVIVQED